MEEPIEISCPWCGERFTTFVDQSQLNQFYTEDCQVCCRPIEMSFQSDSKGSFRSTTRRD